jgi:hypothetical protein
MMALRRLIDFWDCTESLFRQALTGPKFLELEQALLTSDVADDEVLGALISNPQFFSLSMLPSHAEASRILDPGCEVQLTQGMAEVWETKLTKFQTALRADQCRIEQLATAGSQVADKLRTAIDQHRLALAVRAAAAARQYVTENMLMLGVAPGYEGWEQHLDTFSAELA